MAIESGKWKDLVTWGIRILIGGVFLFSGFAKAIDPWGTLYKIDAYVQVLPIDIWPNLELVAAFLLSAIEFLIGFFLIFGCFRRTTAIATAAVMAFMVPLTLWIAISNPVADCGCFGDALIISNWATFWKNILISIGTVWLMYHNKKTHWLITPALQWIGFLASAIFILTIELFGYVSQPLIDFRPYPHGEQLIAQDSDTQNEPQYVFVYEKDGVRQNFTVDDELPDESQGWKFIDREEIKEEDSVKESSEGVGRKALRIWSKDGEEDITEDAISQKGRELLIMMPDLKKVSPATTWKLNSLYEWSVKNDVKMVAIVSGTPEEIMEWEDLSLASYPIFTAEDTQIKEVVRGNPGVVYLVDANVVWKRTLTAINVDDFMSPETSGDAMAFSIDNMRILRNCLYIYLITLALIVFLSFTPIFKEFFLKRKKSLKIRIAHEDNNQS